MILDDFKLFVGKMPLSGRVMAIDWGTKRTGYALSDATQEWVSDRGMTADDPVRALPRMIAGLQPKVAGVVVGLPLWADGSESETSKAVRLFADALDGKLDVPIVFLDETLTSRAAEDRIKSSIAKPGRKSRMSIDATAAEVLLEDALGAIKRTRKGNL
jgi:putative Holliday junction resolvase